MIVEDAPAGKKASPAEYLSLERQAELKSEFMEGKIYSMSGAGLNHNMIVENLSGEFHALLKGSGRRGFSSDLRVHIPLGEGYTYPDFMVVSGKPEMLDDTYLDNLLNPILIVEVLSKSTEAFDRGHKFTNYRSIKHLREYILIDSQQFGVEGFFKNDEEIWELSRADNPNESVLFRSLSLSLPVSAIYRDVIFREF